MHEAKAHIPMPAAPGSDAGASVASDVGIMARFQARPGFLLARIDQICTAIHGEISSGETLAQAEFLLLLDAFGAVSQIALARAAGVDKSTTGYVLDNLQTRDLIVRTACPDDRRRALVSLTPAGAGRIARVRADHAELQHQILLPLDPPDRPRFAALLHRLGADPTGPAPLWVPACDPAAGVLDGAASFLLRRLLQVFQAQFLACTPAFGLTLRQFSLLFILSVRPSITQMGFARMFGLDPSTCAVIVRGLVARALIVGQASPHDRRERVYAITPQGRTTLSDVQMLVDRSERLTFRGESTAEIRWLVRRLQRIVGAYSHRLRFPGALAGL